MTVISRVFSIQGIDVWKWYNELPIAQLKQVYNPKSSILLSLPVIQNSFELLKSDYANNIKQDGIKLQDLIIQDHVTKNGKKQCCSDQNCLNWGCQAFCDRFNFEHQNSKEFHNLKIRFNMDF